MPFYIREEKYCPTCGLPTDQCECLGKDEDMSEAVRAVSEMHELNFSTGQDKQGKLKADFVRNKFIHD